MPLTYLLLVCSLLRIGNDKTNHIAVIETRLCNFALKVKSL